MPRTLVTPARPVTARVRPYRLLAAALAAAIATGGAAYLGDDLAAPSTPDTERAAPITFGDPPVIKGARGGKTPALVFGDPTVHKGAGGR